MDRIEAIKQVTGYDETQLTDTILSAFPKSPDVILFGDLKGDLYEYLKGKDVKSINEIKGILQELPHMIVGDPILCDDVARKKCHYIYRDVLYRQYARILSSYKGLTEFVSGESIRLWFEYFLPDIRSKNLPNIKKEQNNVLLHNATVKLREVYDLTDMDVLYLQYFCSHCKVDVDSSRNICLWIWSEAQDTGKTTIAQYITAFLNGENDRNMDEFNSKIGMEMQTKSRFDIPKATINTCTMLDEIDEDDMKRYYSRFKNTITQKGCDVEYKFVSGLFPKKANFKYITTSNYSPEFAIQDKTERRIVTIKWKIPKKILTFEEIKRVWHEFVLECNFSKEKLNEIYSAYIKTNPQVSDVLHRNIELDDYLSYHKLQTITDSQGYFTVTRVLSIQELSSQRISRQMITDVLVNRFGEPDKKRRWKLRPEWEHLALEKEETAEDKINNLPF